MDELEDRHADGLLGLVAEVLVDGGALVLDRAVGVEHGDRVGRVLDEGAEAFFAGAERALGAAVRRHVLDGPLVVEHAPLGVERGAGVFADVDLAPVAPQHHGLELVDDAVALHPLAEPGAAFRPGVDAFEIEREKLL